MLILRKKLFQEENPKWLCCVKIGLVGMVLKKDLDYFYRLWHTKGTVKLTLLYRGDMIKD